MREEWRNEGKGRERKGGCEGRKEEFKKNGEMKGKEGRMGKKERQRK